ncbi:MAG: phosphate-starvation-inducible PsiE family protein [Actinomycetota bacterium]|nr:phosphate-starvation-inducible PsiE family protein [Actinomycetota bacterium]
MLDAGEDLLHVAIGLILFVVAGVVLFQAVDDLIHAHPLFPAGVITGINNVLFIVIILEILRTVTSHFTDGGFQIKPFLVIGVISAVRHILTVSASLTLEGDGNDRHFQHALLELGVNAGVVVALVFGLVLLSRSDLEASRAGQIGAGLEVRPGPAD